VANGTTPYGVATSYITIELHISKCANGGRRPVQLEPDLEEFVTAAVHSAIQVIVSDHEIQAFFRAFTVYFDALITFAFVFLSTVAIKNLVSQRENQQG
jgi:hypothetical protein